MVEVKTLCVAALVVGVLALVGYYGYKHWMDAAAGGASASAGGASASTGGAAAGGAAAKTGKSGFSVCPCGCPGAAVGGGCNCATNCGCRIDGPCAKA